MFQIILDPCCNQLKKNPMLFLILKIAKSLVVLSFSLMKLAFGKYAYKIYMSYACVILIYYFKVFEGFTFNFSKNVSKIQFKPNWLVPCIYR